MHTGVAIHVYVANRSMVNRAFYNADGELLIVPQLGHAAPSHRVWAASMCSPARSAVIQRGIKFRVELLEKRSPRLHLRELRSACSACRTLVPSVPTVWPTRATSKRRMLPTKTVEGDFRVAAKFLGTLWEAQYDHSPLDVVAWHGNYAPYKYDLATFQLHQQRHLRSSRSVDLHGPNLALGDSRHGELRLRHLSAALDGGRAHLPPAVVPSQLHERVHGTHLRPVRRQGRRLRARRREPAQLHVRTRSRRRHLRESVDRRI